ncbi:MAG: GNAT family N-acetyltransferase [Gallionella sp.]|nr:GNAT family N-acetyltransferase [Gallionella sp.]
MTAITSERLLFRPLSQHDVTERYVSWLNDPEVNRYLEIRFSHHTLESCSAFVAATNADPTSHLFGIFDRSCGLHIGNIKIGFIKQVYSSGQLSLFLGEKSYWGKGFATEAISAITGWAFNELALIRVEAGCCDENLGSLRAFLKVGYTVEGYFRKNTVLDNRRIGGFWLGILNDEFNRK